MKKNLLRLLFSSLFLLLFFFSLSSVNKAFASCTNNSDCADNQTCQYQSGGYSSCEGYSCPTGESASNHTCSCTTGCYSNDANCAYNQTCGTTSSSPYCSVCNTFSCTLDHIPSGHTCVSGCNSNSDCQNSERCSGGSCTTSCPTGQAITSHVCYCTSNTGCPDNEQCYSDAPNPDYCDTYSCSTGQVAKSHTCLCNANSGCGNTQYCSNYACKAVSCGTGQYATNHTCVCNADSGCASNQYCAPNVPYDNYCATVTCGTGYIAKNHTCLCNADSVCGDTQTCNLTNNTCQELTCGTGQYATNHTCICNADSGCASNQYCASDVPYNYCQDLTCGTGQAASNHACICTADSGCDSGKICNKATGACMIPQITLDFLFSSNTGTTWEVVGTYKENLAPKTTFPIDLWLDNSATLPYPPPGGAMQYNWWSLPDQTYITNDSDTLSWHTACVDPNQAIGQDFTDNNWFSGPLGTLLTGIDSSTVVFSIASTEVTCHAGQDYFNGISTLPQSCGSPNNWGYVAATGWCPSGPWCMKGGQTYSGNAVYKAPLAFSAERSTQSVGVAPSRCTDLAACSATYCGSDLIGHDIYNTPATTTYCGSTCPITNGVCGATHYLCIGGTNDVATDVKNGTTSYTWTCDGINGGANAACTEPILNCTCPATHYTCNNSCTSGNNVNGALAYTWNCNSPNGGANAACSETKLFSGTINVLDTNTVNACSAGTAHVGATVTSNASITGNGATGTSFQTNANGQILLTNVPAGSTYTFTLSGTNGYSVNPGCVNSSNTITANFASDGSTFSWYVSPSAPTCIMTANPSIVDAGGTSALTASYVLSSGANGTPTYTWFADTSDVPGATIINQAINTGTKKVTGSWKAPTASYQQNNAYPSVQICNPNGGACGSCGITIKPPSSCSSGQTYPYSICQNNTCTQVNACGTTDCSSCPIACPAGQNNPHYTCQNGACTQANACGVTNCSSCTACSAGQSNPYSICQNGACTQVKACGVTNCSGCGNFCPGEQSNPYSTCQNGACTQVNACGISDCSGCPIACIPNVDCPIKYTPTFTAGGQVYTDTSKTCQQAGAQGYPGAPITICAGNQPGGCQIPYETLASDANGNFTTTMPLTPGQYTAILGVPTGYQGTCPKPPIAVFTVGNASTPGDNCSDPANKPTPPAICDANGNVQKLYFGITNSIPWMQASCGDITGSYISNPNGGGGFTDNIPAPAIVATGPCSANGAYASVTEACGTAGIINAGTGVVYPGQGQLSAQSWLIGGLGSGNYPYSYALPLSDQARTSYANLTYEVSQSNVATKPLNSYCGTGGTGNCVLSSTSDTFPSGVYTVSGGLTLNGTRGTYTFPVGGSYVILVNGILNINTNVLVPKPDANGANGSFALFSASDDINVGGNVGTNVISSTIPNIEGDYSTDKSFTVLGSGANGGPADCTKSTGDLRLNVNGAIVVNAVTTNNGGFYYDNRDLCNNNQYCPVFTISERPDFILSTPPFLMFPRRTWQEVAP